ncbi:MAG TPA: hypothetical protein VFI91_11075 [Longimicrobiaceae bacterium]|nr:hypothetical protein [Longimicrobiaceae bacterium]
MRSVLAGGALLVVSSCFLLGSDPPAAPVSSPWSAPGTEARLYYDNGGGIRDSMRMVIRNAETFDEVWGRATAGQSSPPAMPTVDFGTEMVLLVAAGRMTPDDQIHVDSVRVHRERGADGEVDESMMVLVRVTDGCEDFNAAAYPLEIVRVRRFDGPVVFTERSEPAPTCPGA